MTEYLINVGSKVGAVSLGISFGIMAFVILGLLAGATKKPMNKDLLRGSFALTCIALFFILIWVLMP